MKRTIFSALLILLTVVGAIAQTSPFTNTQQIRMLLNTRGDTTAASYNNGRMWYDFTTNQIRATINATNQSITNSSSSSGIGGSTGSTDNAILRADGTGGSTLQSSAAVIDDSGNLQLGISSTAGSSRTITPDGSAADVGLSITSKGNGQVNLGNFFTILSANQCNLTSNAIFQGSGFLQIEAEGDLTIGGTTFAGPVDATDLAVIAGAADGSALSAGFLLLRGGPSAVNGVDAGSVFIEGAESTGTGAWGNVAINSTSASANFQSMERGIFINAAIAAPAGNPSGGSFMWADPSSGNLRTRNASGVVTSLSQPATLGAAASDETTPLTTGTAKVTFRMPAAMTVTAVRASLTTAQASGSILTIDINENGTTILSTKITIDNTEKTSTTAATPPVISDTALADDAEITVDIDQIGTSGATGLKIWIIGYYN